MLKDRKEKKNAFYGKKHSKEAKRKMRKNHTDVSGKNNPMYGVQLFGKKNGNWKGGITYTQRFFKKSYVYKKWREAILKRDNHSCQKCGKKSNIVHHILSFKDYPKLRLDIFNGQVLCEEHHKEKHRKENT